MNGDRGVLPSRSFISTRPTSKQLAGRRLTEFSLSAVFAPNGKIENQSLQLQWSEAKQQSPHGDIGGINLYDNLSVSPKKQHDYHYPVAFNQISKSCDSDSAWSRSRGTTSIYGPPTTDVFATSSSAPSSGSSSPLKSSSNKRNNKSNKSSRSNNSRRCSNSTATSYSAIMVSYVSVDLRITFFQRHGLIVRKQVVKEIRNDHTVLEVLQHLIKCAGIELNRSMNCDTARLFCLRLIQNGKAKYEEIDYLQWRCALLAEMTSSVTIQFVLDFTDTEDGYSTLPSSSTTSSSAQKIRQIK